jgi:molecular chaperone GrpE
MAVKKKTHRIGGRKPTMQPQMEDREQATSAGQAPAGENELEALETMSGELEAAACAPEDTLEAEIAQARAQTQAAELTDALVAANARADEYLNLAQRVQADFDNYRRRNQNVRGEAYEDGARVFITTLLPVLDNLERALTAADSSAGQSLREGVEMVMKQLADALTKRGVTPIARKGEKFDPNLENAVMRGTPEDGEAGTVCEVLQKGYQMGNFVLRHAMVKVVPD